jgi:hypothetical protein
MSENEHKYIYATLILRGKGLNPQEVTDSLGLSPSRSFKRGDWRNEIDRWKDNFWSLSSQNKVQSNNLTIHLDWLMNQFEPVKLRFLEILNGENIEAEISCFWILPTDHENLVLSAELIEKITDLGLSLSMDIYCP